MAVWSRAKQIGETPRAAAALSASLGSGGLSRASTKALLSRRLRVQVSKMGTELIMGLFSWLMSLASSIILMKEM
jgi:hypothetical protein